MLRNGSNPRRGHGLQVAFPFVAETLRLFLRVGMKRAVPSRGRRKTGRRLKHGHLLCALGEPPESGRIPSKAAGRYIPKQSAPAADPIGIAAETLRYSCTHFRDRQLNNTRGALSSAFHETGV
jgi:hypothetical protein